MLITITISLRYVTIKYKIDYFAIYKVIKLLVTLADHSMKRKQTQCCTRQTLKYLNGT